MEQELWSTARKERNQDRGRGGERSWKERDDELRQTYEN